MTSADLTLLFDRAVGFGDDGAPLDDAALRLAREDLSREVSVTDAELEDYRARRLAEVLRDETGRVRGCSFPGCRRLAVWERTFWIAPNMAKLASMAASFAVTAGTMGGHIVLLVPHCVSFDHYRLGRSNEGSRPRAHEYGCWAHLAGFAARPNTAGNYYYAVVGAAAPEAPPHPLFGIDEELFKAVRIAAAAQNLEFTEGGRAYCECCGLPYDFGTGANTAPGEGDDFWRIFCTSCGEELHPAQEEP